MYVCVCVFDRLCGYYSNQTSSRAEFCFKEGSFWLALYHISCCESLSLCTTLAPKHLIPLIQLHNLRTTCQIELPHRVPTCGSLWAVTLVGVDQVNAASSVLTRVAVALLNLDITDGACVSRIALTGEGGDAIFTHTVVAWLRYAVIDVLLTE